MGYVDPPCLRLGSLDTGPERKQVMRDHSQDIYVKGVKGRSGQRRKLTSSSGLEVRSHFQDDLTGQGDPRWDGSSKLSHIEASRLGICAPVSVSHWEGLPLGRGITG